MDTAQRTAKYIGKPHTKGGPSPAPLRAQSMERRGRVSTRLSLPRKAGAGSPLPLRKMEGQASSRPGGWHKHRRAVTQDRWDNEQAHSWCLGPRYEKTVREVDQKTVWSTYCVQIWRMIQRARKKAVLPLGLGSYDKVSCG